MISPDRAAELFSRALSRASLLPVALVTPAAIVMSASELDVVYAEGDCRIIVETYSPEYSKPITGLDANVPCDSFQVISAHVPSEAGVHDISMTSGYIENIIKRHPGPLALILTCIGLAGASVISLKARDNSKMRVP